MMNKFFKNEKNRIWLLYILVFIILFGVITLNNIIQKYLVDKKKDSVYTTSTATTTITTMINDESLTVKENPSDETSIVVSKEETEDKKLEPIVVYTSTDVNLRWSPKIKENNIVVALDKYTELKVFNQLYYDEWYQICGGEYDELYINKDFILNEEQYKEKTTKEKESTEIINRGGEPISSATYNSNYDINEYFNVYSYSGYSLDYIKNKISKQYPDILPIVEQAWNIEQEYGINLRFTLGVACHETGLGKYLSNTNNYFGLRKSQFMAFNSPSDSVNTFAETIINLSKTYGNTLIELKPIYCPNGDSWTNEVVYFIKNI